MEQGGLQLTLRWDGVRIVAAAVASTRPQAARVLHGLPAARAQALVPRLFSLCGQAQAAAAALALAAAQGRRPAPDALLAPGRAVALEAIGEHLWRLLLDWPPLLGAAARREEFVAWRQRLLAVATAADAQALAAALEIWLAGEPLPAPEQGAADSVALLPLRDATAWAETPPDAAWAARPALAGAPAETGALARHAGDPAVAARLAAGQRVAARLAARHADLRLLAEGLRDPARLAGWLDAAPLADGAGLARVETARGVLLHLTQLKDGRVERYVIVAPTEWNFHPQGAFVREIVGCPAASRAQAEAAGRRLALALDPCVAYQVELTHA